MGFFSCPCFHCYAVRGSNISRQVSGLTSGQGRQGASGPLLFIPQRKHLEMAPSRASEVWDIQRVQGRSDMQF